MIPPFRRFASHHDVPEGNSVWTSLIPKAMRERNSRPKQSRAQRAAAQKEESKEWSPHTFYIVALLIIGSNAMKLVAERQAADTFSRDTKARIGILKDAIQRVHRGEQVDLRRIFGTGIAEDEEGWEEGALMACWVRASDTDIMTLQSHARDRDSHRSEERPQSC